MGNRLASGHLLHSSYRRLLCSFQKEIPRESLDALRDNKTKQRQHTVWVLRARVLANAIEQRVGDRPYHPLLCQAETTHYELRPDHSKEKRCHAITTSRNHHIMLSCVEATEGTIQKQDGFNLILATYRCRC